MKRILFVCTENANRSQMAEGFARIHGEGVVEAYSAGSNASGVVNPRAIAAMEEKGYDLTTHRSQKINEVPPGPYDVIVTMGCGDACPYVPADEREDWELPDPKAMPPEEFRKVRDEIERRVLRLIQRLQPSAQATAN